MGRDRKPLPGKEDEDAQAKGKGKAKAAPPPPVSKGVSLMELRHILVEKHGLSLEVLELLAQGKKSFNEAARDFSIDKAGRSGLLGWKRREELDPIFWEAALLCPEGDYLREPVLTQWGWHIIMVQSRK